MYKLFESAPAINNSLEHWKKKGKIGKECIIYLHDDLDGLMSAIVTRDYLRRKGFRIAGYGIVNYTESWKYVETNPNYINIALDFAEDNEDLDVYIDHHGQFFEQGGDVYKRSEKSFKTKTGSAYEGICHQLGVPTDSLILDVIDMIDSAKYEFYGVDIRTILNFNLQDIMKMPNKKLIFAGAFNQLIKRGDYRTLIEVAHNASLSVFNIYLMFKYLFPANNLDRRTGDEKDFITDGRIRIDTMTKRTRGKGEKKIFMTQRDFYDSFWTGDVLKLDGYQIIGKLAFVPTGTWANALRARAIIKEDVENNEHLQGHDIYFVMLQYGGTLQIADLTGIDKIPEDDLPVLKSGEIIDNLGLYTKTLLKNFQRYMGYDKSITIAGGHKGIGSISNIIGQYMKEDEYQGMKWIDLFKNKIISDISGVKWALKMPWDNYREPEETVKKINEKVLMVEDIRTL